MVEFVEKKKYNEYKFFAAISGIDLEKELSKETGDSKSLLENQQKKQDLPLFMDPDDYDNLSEEEREKMTEKMMSRHKNWANTGTSGKISGE